MAHIRRHSNRAGCGSSTTSCPSQRHPPRAANTSRTVAVSGQPGCLAADLGLEFDSRVELALILDENRG